MDKFSQTNPRHDRGLSLGVTPFSLIKHGLDIRLATACLTERFDCSFHKVEKRTVVFLKGLRGTDLFRPHASTETLSLQLWNDMAQVVDKLATSSLRIGSPPWNRF